MPSISFGVLPTDCLFDETLHITVHGLAPGQEVTLRLVSAGPASTVLASQATFIPPPRVTST